MTLDELKQLLAKATPGPWGWFDTHPQTSPYLSTVDRGRIYVMGFRRRGMNAGQPEFQVRDDPEHPEWGVMRTAAEIGRDWPKHPDAALITAAVNALPALLAIADTLADFADARFHNADCPAYEWSGTQPECRCAWSEYEDEARTRLAALEAVK